jgi:hypothetical protein
MMSHQQDLNAAFRIKEKDIQLNRAGQLSTSQMAYLNRFQKKQLRILLLFLVFSGFCLWGMFLILRHNANLREKTQTEREEYCERIAYTYTCDEDYTAKSEDKLDNILNVVLVTLLCTAIPVLLTILALVGEKNWSLNKHPSVYIVRKWQGRTQLYQATNYVHGVGTGRRRYELRLDLDYGKASTAPSEAILALRQAHRYCLYYVETGLPFGEKFLVVGAEDLDPSKHTSLGRL